MTDVQAKTKSPEGKGQGKTEEQKGQRREGGQQNKTYNKQANGEEQKKEKTVYHHKAAKNPYYKEKFVVTLETVIPDLPKKNEMHPKPDDEVFQTQLDKVQKDIDDTYRKMTDITREARNKNYHPADKTFEDLISLLKVKQDERKKANDELQATVTERDMYKKQVDEYYEKGQEYRFKMKVAGKKSELEARLKELKDQQSKGSITLQEEKKLIREISDLERSLPLAGPLEELDEQSKEVKELLRASKAKANLKFSAVKLLRDECKDIQDKIDKTREEHDKKKEESIPAIDKMKEEYREKINALKKKKKEMYDHHNEAWRKYEDQQFEVEKIKIMKRKKEKLIRDEQRRARDEERRKEREAAEEESRDIPYREQIELCDLLIKYCHRVTPSTQTAQAEVSQKDKQQVIQDALQSNDWKEAKGQYVLSRKEKADDFFSGKKKEKKKTPQTKTEETGAQSLNHQIETLNYFEEIKIAPPLTTDKLPDTLKLLQEKKAYFEKLSTETIEADNNRKNLPEEERKKLEEEEKAKKEQQQQQEQTKKTEKRSTKKPQFNVESEQDFPKM